MRKKDPDTKVIAGLECISRAKAAEYLEMSLSKLDSVVSNSRSRKAGVPLRFFQLKRKSPIWFPIKWLDEWVEAVGSAGRAI